MAAVSRQSINSVSHQAVQRTDQDNPFGTRSGSEVEQPSVFRRTACCFRRVVVGYGLHIAVFAPLALVMTTAETLTWNSPQRPATPIYAAAIPLAIVGTVGAWKLIDRCCGNALRRIFNSKLD